MAEVERSRSSSASGGRSSSRRRPLRVFAAVILAAGVAWNLWWFAAETTRPAFTAQERAMGIQARMYLVVQGLENIRSRTGSYPASLEEVQMDGPDLGYVRDGNGYVLSSLDPSAPFEYRSGDDITPLAAALGAAMTPATTRASPRSEAPEGET